MFLSPSIFYFPEIQVLRIFINLITNYKINIFMLIGKYLVYSISNTIDLGAIKKYFSLVELVILVLVRGSCSRGRIAMHRQLRQLLTIRLKKKKKKYRGFAMRFASSAHEAVSKDNRTGSKVLALLRETLRSHGNEPSRKRLAFSLPGFPPWSSPLFRFSAISGWASREFSHFSVFQHRNLVASSRLDVSCVHSTFYTFNTTFNLIFNLRIALWWSRYHCTYLYITLIYYILLYIYYYIYIYI